MLTLAALVIPSLSWAFWEQGGPEGGWITDMAQDDQGRVLVAASGHVYRAAVLDQGVDQLYPSPSDPQLPAIEPLCITTSGTNIVVGTNGYQGTGILRSEDDGETWEFPTNNLSNRVVKALHYWPQNQTLYGGTFGNGLFSSLDNAVTFTSVPGFPASFISFITSSPNGFLYIGVELNQANLYRTNDGLTFTRCDTGVQHDPYDLWVDSADPTWNTLYLASGDKILISTDGGATTWTSLGAPAEFSSTGVTVDGNGDILAANYGSTYEGGKVHRFHLGSWSEDSGLPGNQVGTFLNAHGGTYLTTLGAGTYYTTVGATWEKKAPGMYNTYIDIIHSSDPTDGRLFAASRYNGIHGSDDGGRTWQDLSEGIPWYVSGYDMTTAHDGRLLLATSAAVYGSMNDGTDWSVALGGPATALGSNSQFTFFGDGSQIYRTSNFVQFLQVANLQSQGVTQITGIACDGSTVWVGTNNGVFRSMTNGDANSFGPINEGLTDLNVTDIAIDTSNDPDVSCPVTLSTPSGLWNYHGVTWMFNESHGGGNVIGLTTASGQCLAVEENRLMLGERDCNYAERERPLDVFLRVWSRTAYSPPLAGGEPEFVDLVGTFGDGLWRSEGSAPADVDPTLPSAAGGLRTLGRNPFERSVTLEIELTRPGPVDLRVFDAAGREVAALLHGWKEAGRHRVSWDAAGRPAGVYFSRLSMGGAVQTRSLVLQR
jgi:hypothetical protein